MPLPPMRIGSYHGPSEWQIETALRRRGPLRSASIARVMQRPARLVHALLVRLQRQGKVVLSEDGWRWTGAL